MHIPDGILPVSVALGGYAAAGGAAWLSMHKIKGQYDNPRQGVPRASVMTAAFFAATLIHLPLPPVSVHLVLSGLMGVVLGWYAFPAILVGLFFQAVMFQHGGLTTLGINACLMGLPALFSYQLFQRLRSAGKHKRVFYSLGGFLAGFFAVALGALAAALLLVLTIPAHMEAAVERAAITALTLAYLPVALLEGFFTAMVVLFLLRVNPELLEDKKRC